MMKKSSGRVDVAGSRSDGSLRWLIRRTFDSEVVADRLEQPASNRNANDA